VWTLTSRESDFEETNFCETYRRILWNLRLVKLIVKNFSFSFEF